MEKTKQNFWPTQYRGTAVMGLQFVKRRYSFNTWIFKVIKGYAKLRQFVEGNIAAIKRLSTFYCPDSSLLIWKRQPLDFI